jgi:outer membrane protein with beta-barrel domain
MRATSWFLTAATLIALGASSAAAQHPQTREGFWIAFGFGGGSARFSCKPCTSDTTLTSATIDLKMGGTVRPNMLIGGELNAWTKNENGETLTIGNLSAVLQYYPAVASGFFLKGGLGYATIRDEAGGSTATGNGFGFIVGLGYDFRVGRNFSLTPIANVYYGGIGELSSGGSSTTGLGWKQSVFELGLDFMFH